MSLRLPSLTEVAAVVQSNFFGRVSESMRARRFLPLPNVPRLPQNHRVSIWKAVRSELHCSLVSLSLKSIYLKNNRIQEVYQRWCPFYIQFVSKFNTSSFLELFLQRKDRHLECQVLC